ncbi:MAG: sirohydrochlorin chelatase [Rhodopirellula sp.]|nr:sirohydrochlorin chelatase [Rhodopirellula sp.]
MLLVGHGTRNADGTRQFFELEKHLSDLVAPAPVTAGLLEFQSPSIPEAWDELLSKGVTHIHVAPLLLFAAGHAKQDIPDILMECQARNPHVTFDQSRPLSRHAAILDLAVQRLDTALASNQDSPERTAVIMVGRGSHDPCAKADMLVLSEIISRRSFVAEVFTTFYAMTEPRLPDTLESVAVSGRFDTVVVQPHLIFEGKLNQAILDQTKLAASRYPSLQWLTSAYLGPDPLLANAIANRTGMH